MTNGEVDRPGALAMQAWLRETARNTRSKRASPYLSQAEINLAPHVAFRLEQAADIIGELEMIRLAHLSVEPRADDPLVQCRCGWLGKTSELAPNTFGQGKVCPGCAASFWPATL